MKKRRNAVFYRDAADRCPACDTMRRMQTQVAAKVRTKLYVLERQDLQDLISTQVVKHLAGNIYALRVKGRGPFGQRAFFFITTCRGDEEAVVTEIEMRGKLNVRSGFDPFITRGEEMRADWIARNCETHR